MVELTRARLLMVGSCSVAVLEWGGNRTSLAHRLVLRTRRRPGQQLSEDRPRLHVAHVQDADAFECFHCLLHYFFFTTLCGLRLPMRPLSLPAVGSIAALMRVGLPESMAALTARLSSSGVVTWTLTPPNASMILSSRAPLTKTVVAGSERPA